MGILDRIIRSISKGVRQTKQEVGPNWREMSGGKPMALECQSIDEVVELLETAIVARMVNGVLPVS